ncbi:MAG: sporulation transcription factor Spo0A [Bacilli bacterium]|nr:sporulation transcription factor Spo0A [Bacilli bacterium]
MKNTINMLVVDDNERTINDIKEYFSKHAVINVKKTINNGSKALEEIVNHHDDYDLILMDLILPEIDGMEILERMYNENIKTNVIILTSYKKEYTIKLTSEFGVKYYMLKPFNKESLEKRILDIFASRNRRFTDDPSAQITISKMLHDLGIPSHIKGYQYLRDSIYIIFQSPELVGNITKEVYPEIAAKYDTTSSRVERAIRHAIEVSWARGEYALMEDLFSNSVDIERSKPTNSEFIVTIADKVRLESLIIN